MSALRNYQIGLDTTNGIFVDDDGKAISAKKLRLFLGDTIRFTLSCVEQDYGDGTFSTYSIPAGTTLTAGIKERFEQSATEPFLALTESWTITDGSAGAAYFEIDLSTSNLDDFLQDYEYREAWLEIELTATGGEILTTLAEPVDVRWSSIGDAPANPTVTPGYYTKTESDARYIQDSTGTTLGDLLVYDGSDFVRLPVGSDGQILTADSTASNGVEWATGSGGATDLDDLSDVTITTPTELQALIYDGSEWVNGWPEVKMIQVRNDEGSTIPAGAPLYSKGEIGGSNRILVGIADANDSAKMPCIGIAYAEMNTTTTQDSFGVVSGVYNADLNGGFTGLSVGDTVYVKNWTGTPTSASDVLTTTRPTDGTEEVQNVGIILKTNGTTIQGLLVSAIGRSNDIPNAEITTNSADADYVYIDDGNAWKKITPANLGIGAGDVSAASNIADNAIVKGDGGAKGVQASGITCDDSNNVSGIGNITLTGTVDGRDVATDGSKLDGIATGATANQTDAYLLSRANHTGTQTASTISDFDTEVSDSIDNSQAALTAITLTIDGAGSAITAGALGKFPTVPYSGEIESVEVAADQSGSIVIDIWKAADAIPTNANSITGSSPATLSSAQRSQDETLTGWTTSIAAGDVLGFEVDSASTVTEVTLTIKVKKGN